MNKKRLIEILKLPFSEIENNKDLKLEVLNNYKEVSGKKPCYSCKGKLKQYHSELINSNALIVDEQENSFRLRNDIGVIQLNFGSGEFLSSLTSPDTLCIKFLKVNPARISLFEKYPENWRELIKNNEKENENE